MPLRAVIASLLLAVCSTLANAETAAYAEALDTLYAFDLSTRLASPVGRAGSLGGTPLSNIEGLTFSPTGQLYAVSDTLLKVLMTIDRTTGVATVIGPLGGSAGLGDTGQGQYNVLDLGLSFTCDGRLWLSSGATGSFWQVDPTNASTTKIGTLDATITGLTARGNQLFGAGAQNDGSLYLINPATAQATVVGNYGNNIDPITTASPGFDAAGQLWSVLNDNPPLPPQTTQPQWSSLATINVGAGSLSVVGDISAPSGLKYPSNATQLPYVGLKGLAIASPCAVAVPTPPPDPAPAASPIALAVLSMLIALCAGTSLRRRRQTV
jgi:hypothetical protein